MRTWLLTWNPGRWSWDDVVDGYKELKNDINELGFAYGKWSCGVNKSICAGDRIFMIRLGRGERGMVASGYAASETFEGTHWDIEKQKEGKKARRIYIKYDYVIDDMKNLFPYEKLKEISQSMMWSSQASGISIPDLVALELEKAWKKHMEN